MRYDADHKETTHRKILRNAAREVRARGLQGPAVSEVSREAVQNLLQTLSGR